MEVNIKFSSVFRWHAAVLLSSLATSLQEMRDHRGLRGTHSTWHHGAAIGQIRGVGGEREHVTVSSIDNLQSGKRKKKESYWTDRGDRRETQQTKVRQHCVAGP